MSVWHRSHDSTALKETCQRTCRGPMFPLRQHPIFWTFLLNNVKKNQLSFWPLQINPEFFKKFKQKCENSSLQVITFLSIRNVVETGIWIKDGGICFWWSHSWKKNPFLLFILHSFNSSITNYEKQCNSNQDMYIPFSSIEKDWPQMYLLLKFW